MVVSVDPEKVANPRSTFGKGVRANGPFAAEPFFLLTQLSICALPTA